MQYIGRGLFVTLIVALLCVGCGDEVEKPDEVQQSSDGGDRNAVSAEALGDVENLQLTIHVPGACPEGRQFCESWLGLRDGSIGVVHHLERVSFSIEEVDELGRFRLAAYPDCNRDERIAAMEAQRTAEPREDDVEIRPYTDVLTGDEDIVEGEAPPLLGDGSLEVTAPPNDGIGSRDIVREALSVSPFQECRRVIVPGATLGDPVEIVDPSTVDEQGWWQIRMIEGESPAFVSADECFDGECHIRLFLDANDMLVAVHVDGVARQAQQSLNHSSIGSAFKSIGGSVTKTWNSGVTTVSQAAKSVGTVTHVNKLGNKNLYVSAAAPAARLYSAVEREGPQALSLANGVVNEGSVFVLIGAEYATIAGEAIMDGAMYIGEYIMLNACFLGVATGLTWVAGVASPWDPAIRTIALPYAEELATEAGFGALMESEDDNLFAELINEAAAAIATPIFLISSRYNNAEWRAFVIDIIRTWLMKDSLGFAHLLIDKLAKVICEGIDHALSPADAVTSVIHANGIKDGCLDTIKNLSLERTANGDELCWAMRDEINIAAAKQAEEDAKPKNSMSHAMNSATKAFHCKPDPNDEGYLSLLEGVGCRASDVYVSTETPVDPSTVLNTDHQWAGTSNWQATLKCGTGKAAVGMCSSGKNIDCNGRTKELLCASRPGGGSLTNNSQHIDKFRKFDDHAMSICPNGWITTEFCSSGANNDCSGYSLSMRCRPLASDLQIDYSGCTVKETADYQARLQSTSPNDVIVGMCTVAKSPNCGLKGDLVKGALFCPIAPATNDGTHTLFWFYNGSDDLITKEISESPWGYQYLGSFQVYKSAGPGRSALYRCRKDADHFVSRSSTCEGQIKEDILGHSANEQGDGQPIYRCAGGGNRRITTDLEACIEDGRTLYAILGYTPSTPGYTPPEYCSSGACSSSATSCKDILDRGVASGNGLYAINPSGVGQNFQVVYCDMTTDGGGWTLVTVNGTDGRPNTWSNNAYPRPGASNYGSIAAAAHDVRAISSGGAIANNYSHGAKDIYANSNREFLAYVGGATNDYVTGTLPQGCNYFDGAGICEENAEYFTVYKSDGTPLTTSAQACTTAAKTGSWKNDSHNEFGLHLLDGPETTQNHCHRTSSSLGHQKMGRIYTTFEQNSGGYWNAGVHSHWNEAGGHNVVGYLMIR